MGSPPPPGQEPAAEPEPDPEPPSGSEPPSGLESVELPYQEVTTPEYAALAAALFTLEEDGQGMTVLRGSCPRCGAALEATVASDVLQGMRLRPFPDVVRRLRAAPRPGDRLEPMLCTCGDAHPGRPEGRVGCGAYWTLLLTEEPE
ncbi:hypothetical protein ACWGE1_21850 [Streptomyces sp. NPDC054932]